VDLKKVSSIENMISPTEVGNRGPAAKAPQGAGPSFQETLQGTLNKVPTDNKVNGLPPSALKGPEGLKFSNHAVERMQSRGIAFNKGDMNRLNEAVDRAAAKGSKDTLVLMDDSALIVSVKNKTVVTVMDKAALKENVFTNIDSTIVM